MACARGATTSITEWLLYHQAIGFDHVYLYCNDDDPIELYGQVLPFCRGEAPFVTFHHFPFQDQKFYMLVHALRHHKDESRWVAFLDIDEFLVLPRVDDIQAYLWQCPTQWDSIHFNRSMFGNDLPAGRPAGSVLLNHTRREDRLHHSTRTLTRTAKIDVSRLTQTAPFWRTWDSRFGPGINAVNVLGDPMQAVNGLDDGTSYIAQDQRQARIRNTGLVNHYAIKSTRELDPQAEPALTSMNAVEDTYLADHWRHRLRACEDTLIVPSPAFPNIALGKSADQSSHSQWSRGATRQQDAAGVVNGTITGTAQCHTNMETRPWWMVDFGAPHLVHEVRLFNRVEQPELRTRLGAFCIEIAEAAGPWVQIYEHDGKRLIGGADGHPLIVKLASPVVASRLRVVALGYTYLHLDQVQVHGVPATAAVIAAAPPVPTADRSQTATATTQPAQPQPPQPQPVQSPPPQPPPDHSTSPAQREVARIALGELLALAQREPVLRDDFLYVALVAVAGHYARHPPLCQDTVDALHLTQIVYAEYLERLEQPYPPTFHVALRDATVFGHGSVVTAGGALLIDSCWEFFSQGSVPPGLTRLENGHYRIEQRPSRHIDRPSLLLKRPFWSNYGHFLVDGAALLARLPAMKLPADCQIIIGAHQSAKMQAIVREAVDILAPGMQVIEQPDHEVWTVSALHYVTPQQIPPLTKLPAAMMELGARMHRGLSAPGAHRRLYVARETSLGRQLINEDQVIAVCQRLGFEVVWPEQHSLRDQAALFRSAECVVGVKGAALTNIVFCSSTARLFVLSPADWPDPFYWDLASQLGMGYGEMFGPLVSGDGRQSMHQFAINAERLAQNLAAFCQPKGRPGAPIFGAPLTGAPIAGAPIAGAPLISAPISGVPMLPAAEG
jgi:capsular polysaccharide biosynthesis protein